MNSKRLYFVLIAAIILLAGAGVGAVVYGNLALQQKTTHLVSLKAESVALEEQQRSLIQARKDIQKYSELEQIVSTILPKEKDQARTVLELNNIAKNSNVRLGSIIFPSSTLGQAAAKPAAPAPSGEGGTSAQPAAPAATAAPTTQVKAVTGIAGLYQMDVNVQSAGPVPYGNFLTFLKNLENNRSTSQISNLNIQPDGPNVTFNFTITVFIKP